MLSGGGLHHLGTNTGGADDGDRQLIAAANQKRPTEIFGALTSFSKMFLPQPTLPTPNLAQSVGNNQ